MKTRDDVSHGQHTHVGMTRTANEDFLGYWEPDEDRQFDIKGRLVVVCDGMGGHNGGEIASRLAVKTILKEYEADGSGNVLESLRHAIERANEAVFSEAHKPDNKEALKGMGTTVTAIAQRRDMVYFAQVGDSRAYLIRGDAIKQMTKDHSLVQQLVDEGLLEESEMESHPDKNVILRSLGVKPQVDVDISYAPIAPGDVYLVCSDGLSGLVSPDEMLKVVKAGLSTHGDARKVCEQLIELANKYGGHDNITVQVLKVVRTDPATSSSTPPTPGQTVTQAFSPDQVQESIAAAKAKAGAKGGANGSDVPTAPATRPGKDKSSEPASGHRPLADTAPAIAVLPDAPPTPPLPVPILEPSPRRQGSPVASIAFAALGAGLCLGLLGGLVIGWSTADLGEPEARTAAQAADSAAEKAIGGSLRDHGEALRSQAHEALKAGRWDEARSKFDAARTLYEASRAR